MFNSNRANLLASMAQEDLPSVSNRSRMNKTHVNTKKKKFGLIPIDIENNMPI
jgi:hypothetical protein